MQSDSFILYIGSHSLKSSLKFVCSGGINVAVTFLYEISSHRILFIASWSVIASTFCLCGFPL